ncbi:MAG: rRNA maturation RNase YbeY [Candidatus Binatia bacterium]
MAVDLLLNQANEELRAQLERCARFLLDSVGCGERCLSVAVVDEGEMRELNGRWRGRDTSTDVLSFSQMEGIASCGEDRRSGLEEQVIGDVVICLDSARMQAEDGGWTLEEELNRLLLHGFLHLLGYDHEAGLEEARRMKAEEARLVELLREERLPCAAQEN